MSRYVPSRPEPRDKVSAAAFALGVAVGVGAVAYYLARIALSREELPPLPREEDPAALPPPS